MKIFELKTPILTKIKTVVGQAIIDGKIPAGQKILYLDYEPDDGYIRSVDYDGAIAVYAAEITFPAGVGSVTGDQNSDNILIIDCYGFGDPIKDDIDPESFAPTTREAELRSEVLTTLVYKAIMDRQEVAGSATVEKWFGTDIDATDRYPQRIQKFPNMGTMDAMRGICAFRSMYKIEQLVEDVPSEPLGLAYDGADNMTSDTYDPGSEPG